MITTNFHSHSLPIFLLFCYFIYCFSIYFFISSFHTHPFFSQNPKKTLSPKSKKKKGRQIYIQHYIFLFFFFDILNFRSNWTKYIIIWSLKKNKKKIKMRKKEPTRTSAEEQRQKNGKKGSKLNGRILLHIFFIINLIHSNTFLINFILYNIYFCLYTE